VRFEGPDDPKLLATLVRYRDKFATTLAGCWSTAHGTFDAIMSERWEFRADGTVFVTSQHLSETDHEVYRWESEGPFRVRLGLPPDEEDPEGTWKSVAYEFAVVEHDAGHEVVLREIGQKGFWLSTAPLRRVTMLA
jgi:hypothetical protein